jgi:hypothetical protein
MSDTRITVPNFGTGCLQEYSLRSKDDGSSNKSPVDIAFDRISTIDEKTYDKESFTQGYLAGTVAEHKRMIKEKSAEEAPADKARVRILTSDIRDIKRQIAELNALDLADIDLVADDGVVYNITDVALESWKFTGLSNFFFLSEECADVRWSNSFLECVGRGVAGKSQK